ncbi:MAG TPA: SUMF1/EgtB/PvdO family nonheme iron enzyme [Thermoanaerobaculia bacterium]|nr:SUMF1/EgtB/PvdO family nonheme iron enzyme [Thermoanaerobaculia bacterium]
MAPAAPLASFTFVSLAGTPPSELGLEPLPSARSTFEALRAVVEPFLASASAAWIVEDFGNVPSTPPGLHLIYLMGHAWPTEDGLAMAVVEVGEDRVISGRELVELLGRFSRPEETIIVLDSCHAAAIRKDLGSYGAALRFLITASGEDEAAISLPFDRATRLALALASGLGRSGPQADLVRIVTEAAEALAGDGVLPGQTVDYSLQGSRIVLLRPGERGKIRRGRTVRIVRNILLASGAVAATAAIFLGARYRDGALILIDLGDLRSIAGPMAVEVWQEIPQDNRSVRLRRIPADGRYLRAWLPAADLLVRLEAKFNDGLPRGLAHHLVLAPRWSPIGKRIDLNFPEAAEVEAHPGMAWIPSRSWIHDRDVEPREPLQPFWIDLEPVTVAEYRPRVEHWLAQGKIRLDESMLLMSEQRRQGLENVGLGQVESLGRNLADIFEVVEEASAERVTGGGELAVGLGTEPCDECPTPMTRHEAELYCAELGKRLPTDLEWELGARGVDGRVYPWGNRFVPGRANVGLPEKGDPQQSLRPVREYAAYPSPFGLIDLVGNAGDWVVNESGSYERVFMGATYRFNPEDATTFLITPVIDENLTIKEITVRCAANSTGGKRR